VGRATARAFARRGWSVGLIARGPDGLEAAKREVEHLGGRAAFVQADVADPEAIDTAGDWLAEDLGPIRVWINDAMITAYSPFEAMSPDEFRRITDVCYLGQVHGTRTALRHMRRRDRGTIVNVGSGLAYQAVPFQSADCGAKFAVRGFTDALRSELIRDGSRIRLSMVHLPGLNTPQFDMGLNRLPMRPQPAPPVYQPEVAARAIVRAAYEAPRELWVGGPVLKLIAGEWAAPGYLDEQLADAGFDGQQSETPEPGGRPNNLFTPVPGDHGAHGRYDDRAQDDALIVDPDRLRKGAAGIAAAGLATLALVVGRRLLR
ncbi:MAG: SDR family oxidoreductase, partial [Geminicoccaceae bacterium]|nr:SDR family oxidoreductase [Geminicoccaceae bacterium]